MAINLDKIFSSLRLAARAQRHASTEKKNSILLALAETLEKNENKILSANAIDLKLLDKKATDAFRDRLTLNSSRIAGMAESLRQVAALPDPVGETIEIKTLKNGLKVRRVRAPLGVILMVFESRPNVILEAFSLAFKAGNVIALRGGSDSAKTSSAIYKLMRQTLAECGFETTPFYGFEDYDRKWVSLLLKRNDLIDVVVPRGGERLIQFVQQNANMPIIKNDRGLCHAYVDATADLNMATQIVLNGKTQRPGVCNALETLLVHKDVAKEFLPMIYSAAEKFGLQWRVDKMAKTILKSKPNVRLATTKDFDTEHLDLILNCKIVPDLESAITHIEQHGSRHSEVIVTREETNARKFQDEIDAAAVYWNASTRFTDGFELGLGGELGISTQKLHVRGPVGLKELTSARWLFDGTGQTRL